MTETLEQDDCSTTAALVAPEDVRRGDFVAVLSEVIELPSFLWNDALPGCREDLVRIQRLPTGGRPPLKVKELCLPFVFAKLPCGGYRTIDVRLTRLVRLEKKYAKKVWKALKQPSTKLTFRV